MRIYKGIRNLEKKFPDIVNDEDWKTLKLFLEPYEYFHRDDIVKRRTCARATEALVTDLETLWPDVIRMMSEHRDRGEWVSHETFRESPIVMAKLLLSIRVHNWFDGCFGESVEEEYIKLVNGGAFAKDDELQDS